MTREKWFMAAQAALCAVTAALLAGGALTGSLPARRRPRPGPHIRFRTPNSKSRLDLLQPACCFR